MSELQKGFYALIIIVFLAGSIVGWCVIESLIWIFSFVSFGVK